MAYAEVGGTNPFIATYGDQEATGALQVEYSRNIKSFPHLQYSEIRPVTQPRGYYLRLKPEQAGRVRFSDAREFAWPPGGDRPTGTDNQEQFEFEPYLTQRTAHSVILDNRAIEVAAWQVAEAEVRAKAQQAMTERAVVLAGVLSNATWGSNTATVATLVGSANHWDDGAVATPYIKKSLQAAAIIINQATLGVITPKDLVLVISPDTATAMSQSAEIQSMLSNSVWAYPLLTGSLPDKPGINWSLPPTLYGFRVVVEDTVQVTSTKGAATPTYAYTIPKGTAYFLARRENETVNPTILKVEGGELSMTEEERESVPTYSTLLGIFKEEMTTEQRVDAWHRRTEISIANDYTYVLANPLSGFKFTSTFG